MKLTKKEWEKIISMIQVLNSVVINQKLPEEPKLRAQITNYLLKLARENDKLIEKIKKIANIA